MKSRFRYIWRDFSHGHFRSRHVLEACYNVRIFDKAREEALPLFCQYAGRSEHVAKLTDAVVPEGSLVGVTVAIAMAHAGDLAACNLTKPFGGVTHEVMHSARVPVFMSH